MSNVISVPDKLTWDTMGMIKRHLKELKINNIEGKNDQAIARNEGALRFFMEEIIEEPKEAAISLAA